MQGVSYSYTDNREIVFPFPFVTTVFSASNYCGSYGNKGAVMIFYPDDIQVYTGVDIECEIYDYSEKHTSSIPHNAYE